MTPQAPRLKPLAGESPQNLHSGAEPSPI